ncbi:MAG: hypothetical protein WC860_09200 [Candidatus Margulisiibacteriota bacterium]
MKKEIDVNVIKGIPKLISDSMEMIDHLITKLHEEHNWFPGGEDEFKHMTVEDKLQILTNIVAEAAKGSEHHSQILQELKVDPEFKVVMFNALIVGTGYMIMKNAIKPKKKAKSAKK